MNLDLIAGIFSGWVAWCMFTLFAFSDAKHERWVNMPNYVRAGLWLTGFLFAVRSVNLITLAPGPLTQRGHVNFEGLIALCGLTYTITAVVVWSGVFNRLPDKTWARLSWVRDRAKAGEVAVMLKPAEVEQVARADGWNVNADLPAREELH